MKIRNIFSIVALASSLLFTSCEKEDTTVGSFDNIKLDKTFLSFPANGGTLDLKVTATEDWKFVVDENWPKVVTFNDGKKATHDVWGNLTNDAADIKSSKDSWVQADIIEGKAGEVIVKFTAEAFKGGREQAVAIVCGGSKQHLVIRQGDLDPVQMTCKEIKETATVGASYSTRGVVTKLGDYAKYGAFYINDGTYAEDVQIYSSTKDSMKEYPKLEVGDSVYFSGTWSSHKNFENVTITKHKKSLAKVISASREDVSMEGEVLEIIVAFKGKGVNPVVPEAYQSWVSVLGIISKNGTPTKLETNPADTAYVTVRVEANAGGDRSGVINFTSSTSDASSEVSYGFPQKGAIIKTTIDKLLAAEDGATQYKTTGYITKDENNVYGNIYIKDATGEIYVYGVLDDKGQPKQWKNMGIKEGDIVTVVGPKTSHKGTAQLQNVTVENHIKVQDISLADFRALKDDKTAYYRISGKVAKSTEANTKFDLTQYGNFALTDGTTEVYVFGVRAGWGGAKGQFGPLGIKEGDELTIVCYKTSFKGLIEADGCFYVSHKSGSVKPDEPKPGDDPYSIDLKYKLGTNAYDNGVATINGQENVKVLKIGTSKAAGDITITIPAGSKRAVFYAVAWKGKATTLEFSTGDVATGSIDIKANNGASNESPYTLTVSDKINEGDKYEVVVPEALPTDMDFKITTASGKNTRAIIFGIKAFKE